MKKVLVPIAGQTACRIMQSFRRLGIPTVAICSDVERSPHVLYADEIFNAERCTDPAHALSILKAAVYTNAEAIHPGYGTLARNVKLAELCERGGIQFMGPPSHALRSMNDLRSLKEKLYAAGLSVLALAKRFPRTEQIGVPIVGDKEGNIIYLGKVPPLVGDTAVCAAKALSFHGAGTVQLAPDANGRYHFTGIEIGFESVDSDHLVNWQLLVANGWNLPITQADVPFYAGITSPRTGGLYIVPDCWKGPRVGALKFNTDATWSKALGMWFSSVVGRDHGGVQFAAVMVKENCLVENHSFEGEVFGVRMAAVRGQEMAKEYEEIWIETNSADVVKVLLRTTAKDDVVVLIEIGEDIKTKKRKFEDEIRLTKLTLEELGCRQPVFLANVARNMNGVAHLLATEVRILCEERAEFLNKIKENGYLLLECAPHLQSIIEDKVQPRCSKVKNVMRLVEEKSMKDIDEYARYLWVLKK